MAAAQAAGYENAGTIEFLLDGDGDAARFYFLEMNTRLQVEHPITEQVTGVDLVHAQLAVAAGEPLPWTQDALGQRGHAIECRICAEDPAHGFLPQAGPLLACHFPQAPGIRVDAGVAAGDAIPVQYDPLVAKLVAAAASRADTIDRAIAALRRTVIFGIRTNVAFLARCSTIHGSAPATSTPASSSASASRCWRRGRAHRGRRGRRSRLARDVRRPPATSAGVAETAVANPWTTLRGGGHELARGRRVCGRADGTWQLRLVGPAR